MLTFNTTKQFLLQNKASIQSGKVVLRGSNGDTAIRGVKTLGPLSELWAIPLNDSEAICVLPEHTLELIE